MKPVLDKIDFTTLNQGLVHQLKSFSHFPKEIKLIKTSLVKLFRARSNHFTCWMDCFPAGWGGLVSASHCHQMPIISRFKKVSFVLLASGTQFSKNQNQNQNGKNHLFLPG